MKLTPIEKKINNNLKPGRISSDGFLGDDKRRYSDIINCDRNELEKLQINAKKIADRLQEFTDAAFESYDSSIIIEDKYEVEYKTVRGKIICPFAHSGMYRKGSISFKNLENGIKISWTPLNIHMIREHGFFEGFGSKHRLDPLTIKKGLW